MIPFYGADHPELFEIERAAMDRPGAVIAALDAALPNAGLVLDVGAGTGFTAQRLTTPDREVVAAEPSPGMWRPECPVPWVGAGAEALPFADGAFDAAYATWAYFFGDDACLPGLAELHRVVKPGGPLLIVDNAGGDEFTALAPRNISADPAFWTAQGFGNAVISTAFAFDSEADAALLLRLFFGDSVPSPAPTRLTYRVFLFSGSASVRTSTRVDG